MPKSVLPPKTEKAPPNPQAQPQPKTEKPASPARSVLPPKAAPQPKPTEKPARKPGEAVDRDEVPEKDEQQAGDADSEAEPSENAEEQQDDNPSEEAALELAPIEGTELVESDVEAVRELARKHKLSREDAQALLASMHDRAAGVLQRRQANYDKTVDGWAAEVENDPDIGRENLPSTQANLRKVLDTYDDGREGVQGSFEAMARKSGALNSPAVVRFLNRIAQKISEPRRRVNGDPVPDRSKGEEQPDHVVLYGDKARGSSSKGD